MKIKKFLIVFTLFMVLLCSLSAISAASDNTIDNLTSEIDSGVDSISVKNDENTIGVDDYSALTAQKEIIMTEITVENKTFADIQNAVDASQLSDIIELEGTYSGNGSIIYVDHDLTFVGKNGGAILDARNMSAIIHSNASKITFKNIVFKNGMKTYSKYYNNYKIFKTVDIEGDATLEDCQFININGDSTAIYCIGNLNISNTNFSNISYRCKAIDGVGNLTINRLSFRNCSELISWKGPKINMKNTIFDKDISLGSDNLIIDSCTFNTDPLKDGNLPLSVNSNNETSNLSIFNSKFIQIGINANAFDNILIKNTEMIKSRLSADNYLSLGYSTVILENDTFYDSKAIISSDNTFVKKCEFTRNGPGDSTRLKIRGEKCLIEGSKFKNCKESDSNGGALDILATAHIKNCEFTNNTAAYEGGAIIACGDNSTFINNTFTNNKANTYGGAIKIQGENCSFINNKFTGNQAKFGSCIYGYYVPGATFKGNTLVNNKASKGIDIEGFYKITYTQNGIYDGEVKVIIKIMNLFDNKIVPWEKFKDGRLEVSQPQQEPVPTTGDEYQDMVNNMIGNEFKPVKGKDGSLVFNIKNVYQYIHLDKFSSNDSPKFNAIFTGGSMTERFDLTIKRPRIFFKANSLSLTTASTEQVDLMFYNLAGITFTSKIVKFSVKIYKGNKVVFSDNGDEDIMLFGNKFDAGTYKIVANAKGSIFTTNNLPKTLTLKVNKMKTTVKAPKVTAKYKKSKYFKVTIKQASKKPITKILKVKVKIGKKTFNVKTNSKGILKINTKSLKVGKHAVKITSRDSNYVINGKSTIVIKR